MNFIFNDFKRRFLNGEVPSADTWYYIPVSDTFKEKFEFDDYKLEQYRTLFDFKDVSDTLITDHDKSNTFSFAGVPSATDGKGKLKYIDMTSDKLKVCGTSFLNGRKVDHIWSKVIDDETLENKPMFINELNYEDFKSYYKNSIDKNNYIETYVKIGFYYIRSKDELEWFAERSKSNSNLIGVIGDNIEGVIDTPIGQDDKYPFNGILDGNYFTLDIRINAKNVDNGLVGVLGPQGIVRNIRLSHSETNKEKDSIRCEIPINLKHIKQDGRDINCGLLVGRNYGLVENIDASDLKTFNLYGFVPSVYSVTNKSDSYRWNEDTNFVRKKYDYNNENFYFSNSFCINSPGNICPYVGYFAEGKFYDDAAALCLDTNAAFFSYADHTMLTGRNDYFINIHNTEKQFDIDLINDDKEIEYNPLGLYLSRNDSEVNFISGSDPNNANYYIMSPLYYGLDSKGHWTTRNIGPYKEVDNEKQIYIGKSVICYNTNLIKSVYDKDIDRLDYCSEPSYETTRCSMRMHPQARVAYNVGTIIGANYGSAWNIDISVIIKNTSNFVGFIGGLAGKQSEGYISGVNVSVDNQFIYDMGVEPKSGGVVYYKQTPILPSAVFSLLTRLDADDTIKAQINSAYFSAWHDEGATNDDNKVNTAQNITVDVITYKLKPIFVVGGLFGRYIPSYDIDRIHNSKSGCTVNNVNVYYADNYTDDTTVKSKENAFGVMIGKVDYSVQTNSIMLDVSLNCNNSMFYCKDNKCGEPFVVYPYEYREDYKTIFPIVETLEDGTSACVSSTIGSKFVGVYELKNNVLDSVAFNANRHGLVESNYKKLSYLGIFDYCDYPISLTSHHDGILPNHNLTHYMNSATTATTPNGTYTAMNYSASNNKVYSGYDHWHQYFKHPNVNMNNILNDILCDDSPTNPAGYNKRNVAATLINFNPDTCFSNNISDYIQLYDDYLNSWNMNKLPKGFTNKVSNSAEFYAIGKWWSYYTTNTDYVSITGTDDTRKRMNIINWDYNISPSFLHSVWFEQGFDLNNINFDIMNGIQNTYDGYTTVEYYANRNISAYYKSENGITDYFYRFWDEMTGDNMDTFKNKNDVNCIIYEKNSLTQQDEIRYQSNRIFKKNIITTEANRLATHYIDELDFNEKASTFVNREEKDSYFYYTYNNKIDQTNSISTKYVPLQSAFAFKYNVVYDSLYDKMGYYALLNDNDNENTVELDEYMENGNKIPVVQSNITVGEYYTPVQIREHLSGEGNPTFTTTSISSDNKFAGLLVVDSSGRNVMYYDNENASQLTGNSVYFPCYTYTTPKQKKKFLLEIQ